MTPATRDFWAFHNANPEVYYRLVTMARDLKARGRSRIGIKMLFEVLRWEHAMQTTDHASEFKLNNNYAPRYARLIMYRNPELAGIFNTRELRS